jgi:hypothetical protein
MQDLLINSLEQGVYLYINLYKICRFDILCTETLSVQAHTIILDLIKVQRLHKTV